MGDVARGIVFDDENMTVAEYMTRWLEDSAKGGLAPRTYHNYRLQIRRHTYEHHDAVSQKRAPPSGKKILTWQRPRIG